MADSLTGFTAPGAPPSGPKLASTVMLLRDLPSGGIEVFLVKRSGKSSFMGGAYVFPGGKVDADDGSAEIEAAVLPETLTQAAARLGVPGQRALIVAADTTLSIKGTPLTSDSTFDDAQVPLVVSLVLVPAAR